MRRAHGLSVVFAIAGCGGQPTSTQTPAAASVATPPPSVGPSGPSRSDAAPSTVATTGDGGASAPLSSVAPSVAVATAKAHAEGKHYALDAKAPGTVKLGGQAEFEITLVAKDGYHINEEFPYKLKTNAEPRAPVSFEAAELSRSEGTYTKTEAHFRARFTGVQTGQAKIGGTFALSVCTKKECVIDRIQIDVPVTVQ